MKLTMHTFLLLTVTITRENRHALG